MTMAPAAAAAASPSLLLLALVLLVLAQISPSGASQPAAGPAMILRIRNLDGSMSRVAVPPGREGETTLGDVLASSSSSSSSSSSPGEGARIAIGQGPNQTPLADGDVTSKSIAELELKHGSLITLAKPDAAEPNGGGGGGGGGGGMKKKTRMTAAPAATSTDGADSSSGRFDPFPALAKPSAHSKAARRLRALAHSSRGQSYERISKLREYMHQVEPQPEGHVKRVYMCTASADRFKDGCAIKPTKKQIAAAKKAGTVDRLLLRSRLVNRMGLCFGTIGSERVDQKRDRVRTSLSTPLYEREMCGVAKVQAIWEPPQRQGQGQGEGEGEARRYDATRACRFEDDRDVKRAIRIAGALGLRPVGWIYSYSEDRHAAGAGSGAGGSGNDNDADEDALPMYASDVYYGALLQIGNMRSKLGRDEGKKFVTLALDGRSGATEAFQLSDVSVQMVAEGLISQPADVVADDGSKKKAKKRSDKSTKKGGIKSKSPTPPSDRFVTTKEKFLVDSEETTELDSVLCLVNTALLGHTGTFCGKQAESSVTKKGQLTAKSKKRIIAALDKSEKSDYDVDLFEALCDFNVLYALDGMLKKPDMDSLCGLVTKWARGQRRGTECGRSLKAALRFALEAY